MFGPPPLGRHPPAPSTLPSDTPVNGPPFPSPANTRFSGPAAPSSSGSSSASASADLQECLTSLRESSDDSRSAARRGQQHGQRHLDPRVEEEEDEGGVAEADGSGVKVARTAVRRQSLNSWTCRRPGSAVRVREAVEQLSSLRLEDGRRGGPWIHSVGGRVHARGVAAC